MAREQTQTAPSTDNDTNEEAAAGSAGGTGSALTRATFNLTPRAVEALDRACARTKDTKTDTINRALVVYNLVLELMERGGGSLTFQTNDGQTERVHII
ncbi:hypothetical protein DFJ67_2667 [Asanoa ferruginea]|uniref:Uncharacterized protein n=1 Tax=Asanoa ferruginea TaxID=53367 RepID=A0A3D9ZGZ7_9ACTN|nr:hypothetical protein [Asanoa ferruginea]REF96676.1 hypothetical protein DFJ67_2667 [Asanoa ferruginea]GIF48941.1 hypothetical protein Afe04nite_34800 [Asanoa ferruginea]